MTSLRKQLLAGFLLLGSIAAPLAAHAQFKVQDKWKIGGEGGWDYLLADPSAHLLYVTHGPRVEIIDTATGKAIGAITDLKGTHGIALDDAGKLGYISDGGANAVIVFDRKTFAKVGSIPAGTNPDGIVYEPVTKTVWAFNGRSSDVTVIDTVSQKAIATVKLSGKPEFPTVDGQGNVYDNIETTGSIVKLDAKNHKVAAEWKLGCESPSGMAIDRDHHRLFSVCDGKKMTVLDYTTGKVVGTPAIGDSPDAAGYDAKRGVAYSSNGDGTLTVIDTAHAGYKVLHTLPTQKGARTMAFDSGTGRVYLSAAEYGAPVAGQKRAPAIPGSFSIVVVGAK
jgi:YVTN family beta-propeller protein